MDILILILIAVAFLGLLVLIPLLIIKAKATMNSANISLNDSWKLYVRKTARKPIFQALSIAQKNNLTVTLEQIETHWFANGDPVKLMNALASNANSKEITFQSLSAIDLAGKDIEEAIISSHKMYTVSIKAFRIKTFRVDYHAKYRLGLYSAFGDSDPKFFEENIIEKLNSFAATWDSNDPVITQNFLLTNILNTEYWERVLNAQLIDQDVQIKI